LLLIYGQIGDSCQHFLDGTLSVFHTQDSFPTISWSVYESHFKVLVHLVPGPNKLRFDFTSPKLPHTATHSSWISVNYLPLVNAPPLQLAILLGKDSDGHFDAVPERIRREGNDLDVAIRKFRMAAYLWQAFTGEQMFRNNFGRRCFRFEEEWQTGTLSSRDTAARQMRNEARIHIIRSKQTVSELRDLTTVQQNGSAKNGNELFIAVREAAREYFKPQPGQKQYVAVLLLDSHWDKETQTIAGHIAVGSNEGDVRLSVFGSHCLQTYPNCLEEVVTAFTDCTRTDTNFVVNDKNECGSNWETASHGIGAHLHETGHLFGCLHEEEGVMSKDYVHLNRTFTTREPYSTRTRSQGLRVCLPPDECGWHRLDALRFRFHPCFRLPSDAPVVSDDSVQVWPVDNGKILISSGAGIAFTEIFIDGDDICRTFMEYVNGDSGNSAIPKQVTLTEADVRQQVPDNMKNKKMRLAVYSGGLRTYEVDDLSKLRAKHSTVKLPNGQIGYKGNKLGCSQLSGSLPEELIFESAFIQTKLLTSIKVYHGDSIRGVEFCYEDSTSQMFGKQTGHARGGEFVFGNDNPYRY
jgi:hypothetical protein